MHTRNRRYAETSTAALLVDDEGLSAWLADRAGDGPESRHSAEYRAAETIALAVPPAERAAILAFAPTRDEVSDATLDAIAQGSPASPSAPDVRTVPFLYAGDVISIGDRQIVVCSLSAPYRDDAGIYRYVLTGTGEGPRTVATPVRMGDEYELVTFP